MVPSDRYVLHEDVVAVVLVIHDTLYVLHIKLFYGTPHPSIRVTAQVPNSVLDLLKLSSSVPVPSQGTAVCCLLPQDVRDKLAPFHMVILDPLLPTCQCIEAVRWYNGKPWKQWYPRERRSCYLQSCHLALNHPPLKDG